MKKGTAFLISSGICFAAMWFNLMAGQFGAAILMAILVLISIWGALGGTKKREVPPA